MKWAEQFPILPSRITPSTIWKPVSTPQGFMHRVGSKVKWHQGPNIQNGSLISDSGYSTLPETNNSHLPRIHPKRKLVFQPSIFRCYVNFKEGSLSKNIQPNPKLSIPWLSLDASIFAPASSKQAVTCLLGIVKLLPINARRKENTTQSLLPVEMIEPRQWIRLSDCPRSVLPGLPKKMKETASIEGLSTSLCSAYFLLYTSKTKQRFLIQQRV